MTLEEVVDELYGRTPGEFVAVRTERARQARDAGDKGLATAIGKLRRPTVAAWAVNLLARADAQEVRALLSLGDALREAQRRLSGEQLRALSTQRQQVITALVRKAADLAAAHGPRLTESVLRDIGSTLQAALADPAVAEQLRTGTLTAAASYDGFGPAGLIAVPSTPDKTEPSPAGTSRAHQAPRRAGQSPAAGEARRTEEIPAAGRTSRTEDTPRTNETPTAANSRPTRTSRRADAHPPAETPDPDLELRRELEELLADLESSRAAALSAQQAHDAAAAALADLDSRISALRADLAHAEDERRFTLSKERSTRETRHRAERHLQGLERRAANTRKKLPPN
ncbi:hypothetical protein [Nocardia jejuensis]|uniref:hypothetical protein n=1 Tax=Nocardia jejuensis TaxID=328049 RepID=UPI0008358D63|nr:hypothetical protein [Nocardia jejuensis]